MSTAYRLPSQASKSMRKHTQREGQKLEDRDRERKRDGERERQRDATEFQEK